MMSVIKGEREGRVAFTRTVGNPDHYQSMLDDMIIIADPKMIVNLVLFRPEGPDCGSHRAAVKSAGWVS